jgi:O-antigen/teichoic acid export membrane protein
MTSSTSTEADDVGAVATDPLQRQDAGQVVARGTTIRIVGYGIGMLTTAAASILLLRHLGVAAFGRYVTVTSVLAIVGGVTDAGLATVVGCDLALRRSDSERQRLLANLLGVRMVLTPLGVLAATLFAVIAGYGPTLVVGTVLAGTGLVLGSCQWTMVLPLWVDLRIVRWTVSDLLRQVAALLGIAVLVAARAGLEAFFAIPIVVAVVGIIATPLIRGRRVSWRPAFDRSTWRVLFRETLPLAASFVMDMFYFRLLIVLVSLLASTVATGLYATSFRVVEMLYGLTGLIGMTTLPLLTVAAADRRRLGDILQGLTEVGLIVGCYLVLLVVVLAGPVLEILGGDAYRAAAPVLRIQVVALIPVCLGHIWQGGLIALRSQRSLMIANGVALVTVVAAGILLIPEHGARGAAVAALAAELAFTGSLLISLIHAGGDVRPRFGGLWKGVAAMGAGLASVYVADLSWLAGATLATLAFGAVVAVTRALPEQFWATFAPRFPRQRPAPVASS